MQDEHASSPSAGPSTSESRVETANSTGIDQRVRLLQIGERTVLVADPLMHQLYEVVRRVARTSMSVVIHGETGTGKDIIAEAIHQFSDRAPKRFVRINCAAMPPALLESELFGHERGAFTGAIRSKVGLLDEATGGTLFLDEIGELPRGIQAKLLRVLEDGRVRRVGAVKEYQIDIRVVAATNRDLASMLSAGAFRKDLYYRITNFALEVPPLRKRRSEISLLAEHYLAEICRTMGRVGISFAPGLAATLEAYEWPGNIRELRNVIGRATALCDSQITSAHLPDGVRYTASSVRSARQARGLLHLVQDRRSLREQLRDVERQKIVDALEASNWNQTTAAKALLMPRRTLVWKLASLRIQAPRSPSIKKSRRSQNP